MTVQVFQHVPFEGIGSIQAWIDRHGARVTTTRLFAGDPLPKPGAFDWLIVMGGPMSVNDESTHPWLRPEKEAIAAAVHGGRSVLGICLGAQLIASALGARVFPNARKEIGWFPVRHSRGAEGKLVRCFPASAEVFHWHGDTFDLPDGSTRFLEGEACANQAYAIGDKVVGLQFHLETTRQSALDLIAHSRDEIIPGETIQTEQEMLRDPGRFSAINRLMDAVLDYFLNLTGT
jgi:GMP synthase-like glutamine amidotransferase